MFALESFLIFLTIVASISAELRVGGHVFALLNFTYEVHQSTDRRGRVVTKVRYGLVQMLLDVPRTDFLKAWAADPVKRWSVDLVSLDATSGQATETLHMDGAYCVFYRERFQRGDIHTGSYTLELHLSDPDGFTLTPGGPAAYAWRPLRGSTGWRPHRPSLAPYSYKTGADDALAAQVSAYNASTPGTRTVAGRGKVGTGAGRTVFNDLGTFVTGDFRSAVELLVDEHPNLYALLREAMRIDDTGGGKKGKGGEQPLPPTPQA